MSAGSQYIITKTCDELGVPLAAEKLEGLATCITFLGIEVDSAAGIPRLPQGQGNAGGAEAMGP